MAVLLITAFITNSNLYTFMKSSTLRIEYFLSPFPVRHVVSEVQKRVIGYTIVKYKANPTIAMATSPLFYESYVNILRHPITKGPRTMVSQITRMYARSVEKRQNFVSSFTIFSYPSIVANFIITKTE